ncbi:MAG: hypothetical protein KBT46_07685, partial [Ruminococcus sp.]|nr:hypothetical protein [Candidatus Copronaster equi]
CKKIIAIVVTVVLLFSPMYKTYIKVIESYSSITQGDSLKAEKSADKFTKLIPEDEKDSVYCHFLYSSQWYAKAQIFPYSKYCDWTDHYIELVPEIGEELEEMFEKNPPKWVVLKADKECPEYMKQAIKNYSVKAEEDSFVLYNLNK